MATRSRRSAATEVVEEEEEEQETTTALRFNQPLIGRPGRPIGVGDLLTRLKSLHEELKDIDQEEADRESLIPAAKELAHHNLLSHKDGGVRAWAACCLVEIFRLCAPNAPYTGAQLKDIFTLIIAKIFPALADPSNPYNSQHLFVLRSLAEVKSIVLITDIPSSSNLVEHLFQTCFDVLSGPSKADNGEELSKNVEHHMTAVLSILVDESQTLSANVVDGILAQFLRADPSVVVPSSKGKKGATAVDDRQSTLLLKEAPPAYNMAKNICNSCPAKMAGLIGTYFSSVIVELTDAAPVPKLRSNKRASSDADASEDETARGPSEEDLNEAKKAHRLLRELWRCSPGVLQDIIPHLQEELGAENVQLRLLATETFGDMVSGIGAAGPPPAPVLNPLAYPSQSLAAPSEIVRPYNFLTTPTSPHSFPSQHPQAYHAFLQRKQDKSPIIRAAWATCIGRILMTSAGGVGLDLEEERKLLGYFSESLIDSDERVRLAAVQAIEHFEFDDIVQKLGSQGGASEQGSVLYNLADRAKDKKHSIRTEAMKLLGKLWGVASGAIAEGNERVSAFFGPMPSKILETCYINDLEINVLVDHVICDSLLPLGYPPMKPKASANGALQVVKDSQGNGDQGYTEAELDKTRTERQLILVRDLEEKARKVYFARQANQAQGAKFMEAFLKKCEDYNGGVMDKGEKEIKKQLTGLIAYYAKTLPDSSRAGDDLWKFAKAHDRRNYQLIRFCMAPDSDYRKVFRSIKELKKRIEDGPSGTPATLETLLPLVYRVSLLAYNRSHVPAIIEYSRTDEKGLGATSHEILKEISTRHPDVFKAHVQELCKALESEAPSDKRPNGPGAVDDLKACAGFARKFPKDVPKERKFIQSMMSFALKGSPPKAAKYAVTIIMSSADKKEMHAKTMLDKCIKNFDYGSDHFLTKLAALSQLALLSPQEIEDHSDTVTDIAVNQVLLKTSDASAGAENVQWVDTPDEDLQAKLWALKILTNRLRSFPPEQSIAAIATPVYQLLNTIVRQNGAISSKKDDLPLAHKNRLRLEAARLLVKLSCTRHLDNILRPADFNALSIVIQDPYPRIRSAFAVKLMKYLGQNRLPTRFYTVLFLMAFEPDTKLLENIMTWIRSRRTRFFARKETTLETILARLLSLLAHHPDFDLSEPDSEEEDGEAQGPKATLKYMAQYVLFYLKCVATEDNLSLIYHVAQRVKGVADGISNDPSADENLYILSDLAQAIIRQWEEFSGWSMQAWPGKIKLPAGIFKPLESHKKAQEIADQVWVGSDLVEELEPLTRAALRNKKRKIGADGTADKSKKKARVEKSGKSKAAKLARTPKKKRRNYEDDDDEEGDEGASSRIAPSSEARRKSGRKSTAKSYVEISDDEHGEETEGQEDEVVEDEGQASESDSAEAPANEDVEMEEQEAESEEDVEPTPEPPKKQAKGRGGRKANGVVGTPEPRKKATPVSRGKAKVNGTSSSPQTSGRATRSLRNRG